MQNPSDSIVTDDTETLVDDMPNSMPEGAVDVWQLARQRVLLYLQALHIPDDTCSDLVRNIIRQAETAHEQTPDAHPTALAMRVLHALLNQREESGATDSATSIHSRNVHALWPDIESMPPLNRSSMFPVAIDRNPWWTLLMKFFLRTKEST
jgi:hypothetical protein